MADLFVTLVCVALLPLLYVVQARIDAWLADRARWRAYLRACEPVSAPRDDCPLGLGDEPSLLTLIDPMRPELGAFPCEV